MVTQLKQNLLGIGEVAERTGVATSALRFYEAEGLISAERSDGGQRRFRRETLRRVAFIRIAQQVGLPLDEVRRALSLLPDERTPNKADWARLSRSWRPLLDERISTLTRLRDSLDSCIGCGCLSLKRCALYNPDDAASAKGSGARYLLGDEPAVRTEPAVRAEPTVRAAPAVRAEPTVRAAPAVRAEPAVRDRPDNSAATILRNRPSGAQKAPAAARGGTN